MGKWAKNLFGKESFADVGLVVAGSVKPEREREILSFFDKIIWKKDSACHGFLAKRGKVEYPFVTNVYGAPAMLDVLSQMHDGGCRNIIFIGWAYGVGKNLQVGDVLIPEKSYHFEGVYHVLHPDRKSDVPDMQLRQVLEKLLKNHNIRFKGGVNISVPAVTFQLPHANKEYQKLKPDTVEMELSACFSRARDIGMRAAGILVISDTRSSSIIKSPKKSNEVRKNIIKLLVKNLDSFSLPPVPVKKKFSVDEHLASIIHDPDDRTNVYRKS